MPYDSLEMGYEQGYDLSPTPFEPVPDPSSSKKFKDPEAPGLTYRMDDPRVVIPSTPRPALSAVVTGQSGESAPASSVAPAPPVARPQPAAPKDQVVAAPARDPGAARPQGYRNAGTRADVPNFDPQQASVAGRLEAGIDAPKFFEANPPPKNRAERDKYYADLQSATPAALTERYQEGIIRENCELGRKQGDTPKVVYENLEAQGLIDPGVSLLAPSDWPAGRRPIETLPPSRRGVTPAQLNQAQSDFVVLKERSSAAGVGPRNQVLEENTTRLNLISEWKAGQPALASPEATEARNNGILEQLDPPLMKHGRPTEFDPATARRALFAGGGAEPLVPGGPGAEALTAASTKMEGRDKAYAAINARLDGYGYTEQQKKDITGTQMPEGGPLVDKDGKLLDGVTEGQLQRYGEVLDKRSQSVDKMNERVADLDKKLKGPPELTAERREAMQKRRDDWAKRADDRKNEVKEGITQDAVSSYQSKLPRLMKGVGHSSDQVVQLNNGYGLLGKGADLEKIASTTRRYEAADTPQEKAALKKEGLQDIAQGGGEFVVPTGESDAANQAVTMKRQLDSKEAVYGQGAQGAGQGGKLSEEEALAIQQENALEQMHEADRLKIEGEERALSAELDKEIRVEESAIEAEERLEAKDLRMKEVEFDYNVKMAGVNAGYNMISQTMNTIFQGAMQMMAATLETQQRRLDAQVAASNQTLDHMGRGAADSLWGARRA